MSEYDARARRVGVRLGELGLDAAVVVDPANMHWLTGYDASSYYVPQAVLVTVAGTTHWLGRSMDTACTRYSTHLPADRIHGYTDDYLVRSDLHPMNWIGTRCRELLSGVRRLGYERDGYTLTARGGSELEEALPAVEFVDIGKLVNKARAVKSQAELAYMRQAGQISHQAMDVAATTLRPGVRQSDAVATIVCALGSGTEAYGGDLPLPPCISVGDQADAPHLMGSETPLARDDVVNLEIGGCRRRYHTGLSRTFVLGRAPADLRRLADVTAEGHAAVEQAIRPGNSCADVERSWRAAIARHGYEKDSRIGYGIGCGYAPTTWIEGSCSLSPHDDTTIETDMTFHVIFGMWRKERSYVFSETLRVGTSEPEVLSTHAPGLIEI